MTVTPLKPLRRQRQRKAAAAAAKQQLPPPPSSTSDATATAAAAAAADEKEQKNEKDHEEQDQKEQEEKENDEEEEEDEWVKNSLHITPSTFAATNGMTVVGFWEPGRGFNPLGALHLIAGARGPCVRVVAAAAAVAAAGDEGGVVVGGGGGIVALHDEMCRKLKTAVISVKLPDGRKREVHLYAVPRGATAAAARPARPVAEDRTASSDDGDVVFLGFETPEMAPFHYKPLLMEKMLIVIFDLDETLLQAFTITSLDKRADTLKR